MCDKSAFSFQYFMVTNNILEPPSTAGGTNLGGTGQVNRQSKSMRGMSSSVRGANLPTLPFSQLNSLACSLPKMPASRCSSMGNPSISGMGSPGHNQQGMTCAALCSPAILPGWLFLPPQYCLALVPVFCANRLLVIRSPSARLASRLVTVSTSFRTSMVAPELESTYISFYQLPYGLVVFRQGNDLSLAVLRSAILTKNCHGLNQRDKPGEIPLDTRCRCHFRHRRS